MLVSARITRRGKLNSTCIYSYKLYKAISQFTLHTKYKISSKVRHCFHGSLARYMARCVVIITKCLLQSKIRICCKEWLAAIAAWNVVLVTFETPFIRAEGKDIESSRFNEWLHYHTRTDKRVQSTTRIPPVESYGL